MVLHLYGIAYFETTKEEPRDWHTFEYAGTSATSLE